MVSASDLLLATVRKLEGHGCDGAGEIHRAFASARDHRDARKGDLLGVGAGDALATVFAKRVGHLVANHGGELGIREIEFLNDAAVDHDLAARHAVGVQLVRGQRVHFPGPARRVGAECGRPGDELLRDVPNARGQRAVRVELALGLGLLLLLVVGLSGALLDLLLRNQHPLFAIHADSASLGGLDCLDTRWSGPGWQRR